MASPNHLSSLAQGRALVQQKLAQYSQTKLRQKELKKSASARFFETLSNGGALATLERTQHRFDIKFNPGFQPNGNTIPGVSIIEMGEAKGHGVFVDKTCLQQVFDELRQLGDLKVKVDHGSGVMSTIGYMNNFQPSGDGMKVLGDFHIYESEPEKPRILEIARKNPHHMGMLLEFEGIDQTVNGKTFARCSDISAVALVSDPAANRSLFSAVRK